MSYFDALGGDAVVMDPAVFDASDRELRAELVRSVAERMAPSILGQVAMEAGRARIRGRFAVHAASAEIATDTGALLLRIATRRALRVPPLGLRVEGGPSDPSRRVLDELPQGTGQLLNDLLDTMAGHTGSLTLFEDAVVLSLPDPVRVLLSPNPDVRLTSVTHLTAYIAHEAEQRWPLDPAAPIREIAVDFEAERRWVRKVDDDDYATPLPLYGAPPKR